VHKRLSSFITQLWHCENEMEKSALEVRGLEAPKFVTDDAIATEMRGVCTGRDIHPTNN
jgi:hypothetical protein